MKKAFLAIVLMLLASPTGFGEAVNENSFAELGIDAVKINGLAGECEITTFETQETAYLEGVYTIVSLHTTIEPAEKALVTVKANGEQVAEQELETGNWVRARIPTQSLKTTNSLEVCGLTEKEAEVTISQDSTIGYYNAPEIVFQKSVENSTPTVGKEAKVVLTAENTGSKEAQIKIEYKNTALKVAQITKGDSEFSGTLEPGQSVELSYYVKPKFPVQMDLLPAVLSYTNIFGEETIVKSNRPTLYVKEPEFKVFPTITIEKQKLLPGEKTEVAVSIRNDGEDNIAGITLEIDAPKQVNIAPEGFPKFALSKGETKKFEFSVTSHEEAKASIGCKAYYSDYSMVETECIPVTVEFEHPKPTAALFAGIVFIITAILVYIYIYHPDIGRRKKAAEK